MLLNTLFNVWSCVIKGWCYLGPCWETFPGRLFVPPPAARLPYEKPLERRGHNAV